MNISISKNALFALVALVTVAAIGFGAYWYYPTYVAKSFMTSHMEALKSQQHELAYSQVTEGFKNSVTPEQYKDYAESIGLVSIDIPYSITSSNVYVDQRDLTDRATFTVSLVGKTGEVQPMLFTLVKEFGRWKIKNVEAVGETHPSTKIGADYPKSAGTAAPAASPYDGPETAQQPNVQVVYVTAPPAAAPVAAPQPKPAVKNDWAPAGSALQYETMPSTHSIHYSAEAAAESHLFQVRKGEYTAAIAQLSPSFRENVNPARYDAFWKELNLYDSTLTENYTVNKVPGTITKKAGNVYVSRVAFDIKDLKTNQTLRLHFLLYTYKEYSLVSDWKINNIATDAALRENPSFFPF